MKGGVAAHLCHLFVFILFLFLLVIVVIVHHFLLDNFALALVGSGSGSGVATVGSGGAAHIASLSEPSTRPDQEANTHEKLVASVDMVG